MSFDFDASQSIPDWLKHLNQCLPAYEFEGLVARGGMGYVFRAWQKSLDRGVAIKVMSRQYGEGEDFRKSFATEAKAMARLNHPNLISVYDFGQVDDMPYIVMEYVPGKSLYHSAVGRKVDPREAVRIIRGVCAGLAHAHDHGVIHRDIKPANILLTPDAEPKIGDFGLARQPGAGSHGVLMGTPGYTAPEVFAHPDLADRRSDIYAVGAILYQLVSGKEPDAAGTASHQFVDCPDSLLPICQRAMHPDPNLRYPDARSLNDALQAWQIRQTTQGAADTPAKNTPSPASMPSRNAPKMMPMPAASVRSARPPIAAARLPDSTPKGAGRRWPLFVGVLLTCGVIASAYYVYQAPWNPWKKSTTTGPAAEKDREHQSSSAKQPVPPTPKREAEPPPEHPPTPAPNAQIDAMAAAQREAWEQARRAAEAKRQQESTAHGTPNKTTPDETVVNYANELAPLQTPDLANAKIAVENLQKLAATQSGAAKVRTEQLALDIKNLFTAEFELGETVKAGKKAEAEAVNHENSARQWMRPNLWGKVNREAVQEDLNKAKQIRAQAAQRVADTKQKLVAQLRNMASVIDEFHRNRQADVVDVLNKTTRAVSARSLPSPPKPTYQRESSPSSSRSSHSSGSNGSSGSSHSK